MAKIRTLTMGMKGRYKGGHLPFVMGKEYNIRVVYDDDNEYVWLYVRDWSMKRIPYDSKADMEKEWAIIVES